MTDPAGEGRAATEEARRAPDSTRPDTDREVDPLTAPRRELEPYKSGPCSQASLEGYANEVVKAPEKGAETAIKGWKIGKQFPVVGRTRGAAIGLGAGFFAQGGRGLAGLYYCGRPAQSTTLMYLRRIGR